MKDMKTKPRLLIIEDEEAILQGLADVFVYNGYEVVPWEKTTSGGMPQRLSIPCRIHDAGIGVTVR